MSNHPIQPLLEDEHGTLRFKANAIVRALLDTGALDMNKIAMMDFSREDRVQFAQLIGYSFSGFGELGYVQMEDYEAARVAQYAGETADSARVKVLRKQLDAARKGMVAGLSALYEKHPDDFESPR